MKIILADTLVTAHGWTNDLDKLGEYTLKTRKTPEEMKAERANRKERFGNKAFKVNPLKYERLSVIKKDPTDNSIAYFLPGIWPKIERHLEKNEIAYELYDKRNADIRPDPDYSVLAGEELREQQDTALALVANLDCGIIETTTGWGKSFLIALICKMYPTLNIVVTTSSASVVGTLYEYLNKQMPTEVGYLYGKGNTSHGKRVVVTTLKSLPNIDPEKVHLLLCDECHNVGANVAGAEIAKFCFARRFGFTASPVRNDGSRIVMEALFGPVILKMTYQESVDAGMVVPMKYHIIPCPNGPNVCNKPGTPEDILKRFGYWCNKSRNTLIQQIVYDLKEIMQGQILIMVASLEHAIQLHMLLPWFKVAHYGATDLDTMGAKFSKDRYPNLDMKQYKMTQKQLDIMRGAFAKGTLRYIIATTVFRQGVNFPKLEVLIRADGTVSSVDGIQIPGRLSRLDEGKDCAYLIDMGDEFSQWSHRRALAREETYKQQEWQKITREELINGIRTKPTGGTDKPVRGIRAPKLSV